MRQSALDDQRIDDALRRDRDRQDIDGARLRAALIGMLASEPVSKSSPSLQQWRAPIMAVLLVAAGSYMLLAPRDRQAPPEPHRQQPLVPATVPLPSMMFPEAKEHAGRDMAAPHPRSTPAPSQTVRAQGTHEDTPASTATNTADSLPQAARNEVPTVTSDTAHVDVTLKLDALGSKRGGR